MILIFEQIDGNRVSIDVESIVSVVEHPDCVVINTIVEDFEVINDYEEVVHMWSTYKDKSNVINFSKN
jgi:hypothetical protein